jgi:hypothetical protein
VGRTRAKRLKGFGNAIVLPIATTFIASVIDSFAEAARSQGLSAEAVEAVEAVDPVIVVDPAIVVDPMIVDAATTEEHAA